MLNQIVLVGRLTKDIELQVQFLGLNLKNSL